MPFTPNDSGNECENVLRIPFRFALWVGGEGVGEWGVECGSASRGVGHTPHRILRDTVKERAVRFLLECILVVK